MSSSRPAFVASLAAVTLAAGTARASGFLTDQFGSDHGQPAMANAYSVYFNPGAMAGVHGTDITLDGVVAVRSMQLTRADSALDPHDQDPVYHQANTGQATLLNVLGAPYLGFVTDFGGSHLRLGVASSVPFGGEVSWQKQQAYANDPQAPGAYDGPQRWASISAATSSLYETAAFAYRFDAARLGVGASVSVIRTGVEDTRARNTDGSDTIALGNGGLGEGRSYLNVSGVEVAAALGVYWEATPTLRLGASYSSQPSFGTMRLGGTFQYQPGQGAAFSEKVDMLEAYPDVIRAGATWHLSPPAELRLDLAWQRWSQLKNQCVVLAGASCDVASNGATSNPSDPNVILNLPRNWNDTVRVRLGGAYWVQPETEVFGSFAFESSPVAPQDEDPLVFDSTRLYGTLGVRHELTSHLYASIAYTYVALLPVTVSNSAYGNYPGPNRSPSENGSYSSELYLFDGALSYVF